MMFLYPLGLAFLALLPVVVVFHMLRTRRPPMEFSSTMLWQQLARESTGRVAWRPPLLSPLLLLQLLVILLMALALAQPALTAATPLRTVFIIIDASASMQATDVPGGRLGQAKQQAAELIQGLNASDRVTIIRAGRQATVVSAERERFELLNALHAIEPDSGRSDMRGALVLTGALSDGHANAHVYVYSDGAFDPTDLPAIPALVEHVPVGQRSQNQAIVAAAIRPAFTTGGVNELFARIANYAEREIEVPVRATADGVLFDRRFVRLAPRGQVEMILRLPANTKNIELRIESRDDFLLDNEVLLQVPGGETTRVNLVTTTPELLERVFKLIPNVRVQVVRPENYTGGGLADIWVFDGVAPLILPTRGNMLFVNPPQTVPNLFEVDAELSQPVPNRWDSSSPLLTSIDPASLPILQAARIIQPRWGAPSRAGGRVSADPAGCARPSEGCSLCI